MIYQITYKYEEKGAIKSVPVANLDLALKLAARDSESRVRRPDSLIVKSRNSISYYNYIQIIKLCKKYGYL